MGRTSSARQRLLSAAGDLLWEKSYHSVSVDEICARASIRKGSLYHFFGSKSAVAVSALHYLWETLAKPAYEKHFSRINPPFARIISFLDWLQRLQCEKYRMVGRVLGWPFFTVGCELGASDPAITDNLRDIESAELSFFEGVIRDPKNPSTAAKTRLPWTTDTMRMVSRDTSVIRARTISQNVMNTVMFMQSTGSV